MATPWDGAMRVLRDVLVQRTEHDELHAVSHVAGMAGEEMTLDLMAEGTTLGLKVRVIDSRPVMVEGAVRHRLRLAVLSGDQGARSMTEVPATHRADAAAAAEAR